MSAKIELTAFGSLWSAIRPRNRGRPRLGPTAVDQRGRQDEPLAGAAKEREAEAGEDEDDSERRDESRRVRDQRQCEERTADRKRERHRKHAEPAPRPDAAHEQ